MSRNMRIMGLVALIVFICSNLGISLAVTASGASENYGVYSASYSVDAGQLSLYVTLAQGAEVSNSYNHSSSACVIGTGVYRCDYNFVTIESDYRKTLVSSHGTNYAQVSRNPSTHYVFRHNSKRFSVTVPANASSANLVDECLYINTQ